MSEVADFKPGLEGVVAVETEIAEPDREGGELRYRGVDIEDLVGHYPYENVWGSARRRRPRLRDARAGAVRAGASDAATRPSDLQAETARLSGVWRLGKLNEISDEQAREDLGRLSAQMMGDRRPLGAYRRREHGRRFPTTSSHAGETAAERFLLRGAARRTRRP